MKQIVLFALCLSFCLPSTLMGQTFQTGPHPALISLSENVKVNPYAQVGFQWIGSNMNLPIDAEVFPDVPIEIGQMDVSLGDANFWTGILGFNLIAYEKYSLFAAAGGLLRRSFLSTGAIPINIGNVGGSPNIQFTNRNLESWYVQTGIGFRNVLLGLYWSHFGFEYGEPRIGSVPLANQSLGGDILSKTFAPFVGISIPASGGVLTLQYSPLAYSNTSFDLRSSQATSNDLRYTWKKPGNLFIAVFQYNQSINATTSFGLWCNYSWFNMRGTAELSFENTIPPISRNKDVTATVTQYMVGGGATLGIAF